MSLLFQTYLMCFDLFEMINLIDAQIIQFWDVRFSLLLNSFTKTLVIFDNFLAFWCDRCSRLTFTLPTPDLGSVISPRMPGFLLVRNSIDHDWKLGVHLISGLVIVSRFVQWPALANYRPTQFLLSMLILYYASFSHSKNPSFTDSNIIAYFF